MGTDGRKMTMGLMFMYSWEGREKGTLNQYCTADLQVMTEEGGVKV